MLKAVAVRRILIVLVGLFSVTGLYQNCSKSGIPSSVTSANSTTTTTPTVSPWAAGTPYNKALLPYTPQGRLVADLDQYPSLTGFKAIAVAQNGIGLAYADADFVSQAEADQRALEACQLLASGQACAIFAEGNVLKYSQTDFANAFASVIDSGVRTFSAARVPTLKSIYYSSFDGPWYGTKTLNPGYTFKALAIGNYSNAMASEGKTQAEADRRAIESCQSISNQLCTLYAEGSNVVFNVNAWNWNDSQSALSFGPAVFDATKVPNITDAGRLDVAQIPGLVSSGNNVALAISQYGNYYIASGPAASNSIANLEALALSKCTAQISPGIQLQCILYSANSQVVWTSADLVSQYTH